MLESQLCTLYFVPTPIGNLEEITMRSLRILREVAFIYAEDTRTSGVLLKKYEIATPMRAFHSFNEHQALAGIVSLLKSGTDIALISDAGTPGISDPGFLLARECNEAKIPYTCLPGATALIPALVMSGLPVDKFYFEGFLPHKKGRMTRLKIITASPQTVVLYESPFRLIKCIRELGEHAGPERKAAIIREISKIHEHCHAGTLGELLIELESGKIPTKGEIVIVLDAFQAPKEKESPR